MAGILRRTLEDPAIPAAEKDPANWPELMRREWADDEGRAAAAGHRAALIKGFERARQTLDEFQPDVVLIWGDDQYENFREDLIPPYAVLAYDDMDVQPWAHAADSSDMKGRANVWDEPAGTTLTVRGRPDIGKYLAAVTSAFPAGRRGRCDRGGLRRIGVASGVGRVLELVARVHLRQDMADAAGHRRRPSPLRRDDQGRPRTLDRHQPRSDRGRGPTGVAQLVPFAGCHARIRTADPELVGVRGDRCLQLQ